MIAQSILQLFSVSRSPPDTFQGYTVVERITASTVGVAAAFFDQALPLPGYTAQVCKTAGGAQGDFRLPSALRHTCACTRRYRLDYISKQVSVIIR